MAKVILPNVLVAVLSGAFLTFAIVIGAVSYTHLDVYKRQALQRVKPLARPVWSISPR